MKRRIDCPPCSMLLKMDDCTVCGGTGTIEVECSQQWEAITEAAGELGREGGGRMWIHSAVCENPVLAGSCPCIPTPVDVPASH